MNLRTVDQNTSQWWKQQAAMRGFFYNSNVRLGEYLKAIKEGKYEVVPAEEMAALRAAAAKNG